MRAFISFFATLIGLPVAIAGGLAALAIDLAPTFWERVALSHGATSDLALHPPLWLPFAALLAGALAVVWASKNSVGLKPTTQSTSHGSARNSTTAEIRKKG